MTISMHDLRLIRDSFASLQGDLGPKSIFFYERLFHHAPELRRLFRVDDIGGQGMKFMSTLRVIVENLHDPGALEDRFSELGRAHAMIGEKAGDFDPMRAALIDTLREAMGEEFNSRIEMAWSRAFDEIASAIIESGRISKD